MISRRSVTASIAGSSALALFPAWAQPSPATEASFDQLTYPPFETIGRPELFGYVPATAEQKQKAADVVRTTPNGPTPIAIVQSFIDRFYAKDPDVISQWPAPKEWNPLVVTFFSATSSPANSDMVPWCAAFANWCLERSGRTGSRSAASQSFLTSKAFKKTDDPKVGDLVVFTCYDNVTGKSVGLGHVTFVKERPANGRVKVVGGNQSKDGHSSIISEADFPLGDRAVKRHVNGKYVPCTMRLNSFISIV